MGGTPVIGHSIPVLCQRNPDSGPRYFQKSFIGVGVGAAGTSSAAAIPVVDGAHDPVALRIAPDSAHIR